MGLGGREAERERGGEGEREVGGWAGREKLVAERNLMRNLMRAGREMLDDVDEGREMLDERRGACRVCHTHIQSYSRYVPLRAY